MKLLLDSKQRLNHIHSKSPRFLIDDESKIVIMSDIHRGDGGRADTFIKNQVIYFAALSQYEQDGYTYIEIGDGDELWKNRKASEVIAAHKDVFWMMAKLYNQGRLYMIYGNHDYMKRSKLYMHRNFSYYFDPLTKKHTALFGDMPVYESVILEYFKKDIMLIHGHQVDYMNNDIWWLTRFMVRYVWRPLEAFGVTDPTSAAVNYHKKIATEAKLIRWVQDKDVMLIAGHTHRPIFPAVNHPLYFNCGSGVHPRCITAIEICKGKISLVKWSVKTKDDGTLFVGKDTLTGPQSIKSYF